MTHEAFVISDQQCEEIVRIGNDGTVTVNPKYTVDEAAKAFWDAVIKLMRPGGIHT